MNKSSSNADSIPKTLPFGLWEVMKMAMIDYGAVVIKDGKVMNKNLLFWDMLDAVGWVDQRRIRHEDCDVFTDPNPLHARSNCEE